mmetsp:Transcript_14512/g.21353  ORF Transcript_14512/g.21353 Transcript_14512/m.21353 type:complete len:83 (+) Transcript_14512:680-928(+)
MDRVLEWIGQHIDDHMDYEEALRLIQTPECGALCGQMYRRIFRCYGILYSISSWNNWYPTSTCASSALCSFVSSLACCHNEN